MREVYRAKDTRLDRTVAIKIVPTHLSDNPEFKQRFEREARTVSSLSRMGGTPTLKKLQNGHLSRQPVTAAINAFRLAATNVGTRTPELFRT